MHDMCAAALRGNRTDAEKINQSLLALHKDLFLEANPIPVKWALQEMGLITRGIRLPLTPLSEKYHDQVRRALKKANLL
jgi:4-hydroxy-tetrahydrodipicolinate synthase